MEIIKEEWSFAAANGEGEIFARAWLIENPVAIVQIAHGMSEHSERYDEFARFLCEGGFCVVAEDHAGHGQSSQGHLGAFASKAGGFDCTIQDLHSLFALAEERIGVLPRILFGHSAGSVLTALYAERYEGLTALAQSGTPAAIKSSRLFQFLADFFSLTRGHLGRSKWLEKLTGSTAGMPPEKVESEKLWLSRDIDKVREFIDDPLCGFDYSVGGYSTMLHAYHYINSKKWGRTIPDIPILFVAGAEDTASDMGRGPEKYFAQIKSTGHTRADLKLFPECRHEITNELNRREIFAFLHDWFVDKLPA